MKNGEAVKFYKVLYDQNTDKIDQSEFLVDSSYEFQMIVPITKLVAYVETFQETNIMVGFCGIEWTTQTQPIHISKDCKLAKKKLIGESF